MESLSKSSENIMCLHMRCIFNLYERYGYPIDLIGIILRIKDFIENMIKNIRSDDQTIVFLKDWSSNIKFNLETFCFEKKEDVDDLSNDSLLNFQKLSIKNSSKKIG